ELARAEQQFRTLVEQIPAIPYIVDQQLNAVFLSRKLQAMLGLPPDQPADYSDWQRLLHPDDSAHVLEAFHRHMRTGEPFDQEYRMVAVDGTVVWLHDRATLMPAGDAGPALSHGVMFDVTESRRTGDALREGGFSIEVSAPSDRFSFTAEDLAFRTIKEALSNARKHSSATRVDVGVTVSAGRLEGVVADNGCGFDVSRALDRRGMRLHLGL